MHEDKYWKSYVMCLYLRKHCGHSPIMYRYHLFPIHFSTYYKCGRHASKSRHPTAAGITPRLECDAVISRYLREVCCIIVILAPDRSLSVDKQLPVRMAKKRDLGPRNERLWKQKLHTLGFLARGYSLRQHPTPLFPALELIIVQYSFEIVKSNYHPSSPAIIPHASTPSPPSLAQPSLPIMPFPILMDPTTLKPK